MDRTFRAAKLLHTDTLSNLTMNQGYAVCYIGYKSKQTEFLETIFDLCGAVTIQKN